MINQSEQVQTVNDAAGRAALAWLLAEGLAVEIDAIRFPDGFSPVPAPGLATFVADAGRASADAALAADRVAALALDPDASDVAAAATEDALTAEAAALLAARRVAQLSFGVSAHLSGDDRVERLDRAAVAVLFPPSPDQPRAGLPDDGMVLRSRTRPELVVEVAGAICRLLVERSSCVQLTEQNGAVVELSVDGGTTLHILTNVPAGDVDGNWEPAKGGGWIARWPSPITVREPAEVAADLLFQHRAMSEGDVTVNVSSRSPNSRVEGP